MSSNKEHQITKIYAVPAIYFDEELKMNEGRISPIKFLKPTEGMRKEDGTIVREAIHFQALNVKENGDWEMKTVPEELVGSVIMAPNIVSSIINRKQMQRDIANLLPQETVPQQIADAAIIRPDTEKKKTQKNENAVVEGANYILIPLYREMYLDSVEEHEDDYDRICVRTLFGKGAQTHAKEFFVKCTEISNITGIIGKKFTYAVSGDTKTKAFIENDFRSKTYNIPVQRCYRGAGWHRINERHMYLHQGVKLEGSKILTELSLPVDLSIDRQGAGCIFSNAVQLCEDKAVMYTLLMYSFLGVAYRLFSEAGYAPHFLLFLFGKTGSYKTALAKVLFTQLCENQYREFPRRIDSDTPTALEVSLTEKGRDTVTLVDDFAPAKTARQKSNMTEKLELLVRMVGDGSTKSRSNVSLEDKRGKGLKGMLVITGELRGSGLSSNLRCLHCQIEKDKVDTNMLTWFQSNPNMYTTLIQHFIYFLADSWDMQVGLIKGQFEQERREARKEVETGRLVDTLATMRLMVEIVEGFLIRYCGVCSLNNTWKEEARKAIGYIVSKSERLSGEEEPVKEFMSMLVVMLNGGLIKLASKKEITFSGSGADGYMEGEYCYLLPEVIYKKVTKELRATNGDLPLTLKELTKMLCDERYIVPTANGGGKKIYYARIDIGNGRKIKFWKVPKNILETLTNNG